MNILCIIPSRIGSTRLPRKALALIQGKPMVQRVYENTKLCSAISKVVVATDCEEIAQVISGLGGEVQLTDPELPTGTDRVAVAAEHYPNMDVVINLQGDQPFVRTEMLTSLVLPYLSNEMPDMTTLACPLNFATEYNDPSVVKVTYDLASNAIYFSRSPIPYFREQVKVPVAHHIGIYAFRRDFLAHYRTLAETPLQIAEGLEQLRVLEHGYRIRICHTEHHSLEINTPEDLARANEVDLCSK
ncbi:3-deoxy-manno-octulosonate cytidylyltransferase [soil metagenome]